MVGTIPGAAVRPSLARVKSARMALTMTSSALAPEACASACTSSISSDGSSIVTFRFTRGAMSFFDNNGC